MFACNNVFDKAIIRAKNEDDSEEFEAIQKILREEIVNPLRVWVFLKVIDFQHMQDACPLFCKFASFISFWGVG